MNLDIILQARILNLEFINNKPWLQIKFQEGPTSLTTDLQSAIAGCFSSK